MPSTGVVTDSTATLPEGVAERFGVEVVPLVVNWDGATYRDGLDLTTADFYQRLRTSKSLPKTGAPSMAAFADAFRAQLARYDQVVSINLSSKLSGTFDVAQSAAREVDPRRVRVFDSQTVSICLGWIVEAAAEMGAQGTTFEEIEGAVADLQKRCHHYFIVDTLEFLKRGGRIGRAQALAGTLLNVKPILAIDDGEVRPLERARTSSAASRRMVEIVGGQGAVERLGVVHGDGLDGAREMERQLHERYPEARVDRGEIGSVLGTHAGPGLVGVGVLLGR